MNRLGVFALGLAVALSALALVQPVGRSADAPKPGDVMTGPDLGFRVERVGDDGVVGTFVVRVRGTWAPAEQPKPPRVIPAQ